MLTAIETTGTIKPNHQIELDDDLPADAPDRVRVIVLFDTNGSDVSEREWLRAAAKNPAFDFLADESEDIYTLADGRPLDNEE